MTNEYAFDLAWSREDRAAIFDKLKEERLLKYNLHHKWRPELDDWLEMTPPGEVDVYRISWRGQWCGIYYLSQGFNYIPLIHFAIWKPFRSRYVEMGHAALQHFDMMYQLPAVMGLTPAHFRHVFPVIRKWGFKILGTIPAALVAATADDPEKPCDGVLSVNYRRN